jgi:hypothetical protein
MKSYKNQEEMLKALQNVSSEDMKASGDKSVEFTLEENMDSCYDHSEEFDSIIAEHLEPVKRFCLEKGVPFLCVVLPAQQDKKHVKTFALGYLPGVRMTPLMQKLHSVLQNDKNGDAPEFLETAIELGTSIEKHLVEESENGVIEIDKALSVVKASVTYQLMQKFVAQGDTSALEGLMGVLGLSLDDCLPKKGNVEPLPKIDA